MFTIDAHLDLAMNAMEWNRDLRKSVKHIRESEQGMNDKPDRGLGTVSFPSLRDGNIGLIVATQIARVETPGTGIKGWASPEQAWAQTQGQLQWYRAMEEVGELIQIKNNIELESHIAPGSCIWFACVGSCSLWSRTLCQRNKFYRAFK